MARRGDSVIGIDLGKHVFKGVSLQRKSDSRLVLTSFASRNVPEEFETSDALASHLKLLLRDLGGNPKSCALAVSDPASLLRIIEQPETPLNLLPYARLTPSNSVTRKFSRTRLSCFSIWDTCRARCSSATKESWCWCAASITAERRSRKR